MYDSISQQFGSDHRPVTLDLTINIEPHDFIDPATLINPLLPDQGHGELSIVKMSFQIDQAKFKQVNQRLSFPVFLQPRFISEWLVAKPTGYEKRFRDEQRICGRPKTWTYDQLPMLYTPINCKDILETRNLVISFALIESTYSTPDNYAYAVIDLSGLQLYEGSEV
jgi:hypothetical protein